jgi:transformation/transcription domain-associated protein
MNKYRSYVTILADSSAKDEIKVKAAQELSENFEASTEDSSQGLLSCGAI